MIDEKTDLRRLHELTDMIDNIPENRPLYKDSGLWQVGSDDMEEVYFQQKVNESFYEFIKRVFDADNSYKQVFQATNRCSECGCELPPNQFGDCYDCD